MHWIGIVKGVWKDYDMFRIHALIFIYQIMSEEKFLRNTCNFKGHYMQQSNSTCRQTVTLPYNCHTCLGKFTQGLPKPTAHTVHVCCTTIESPAKPSKHFSYTIYRFLFHVCLKLTERRKVFCVDYWAVIQYYLSSTFYAFLHYKKDLKKKLQCQQLVVFAEWIQKHFSFD